MASEALDEAKSSDAAPPVEEPEDTDRGDAAAAESAGGEESKEGESVGGEESKEAEPVGGEESKEAEAAGGVENKVEVKRKRGRKRKEPGEVTGEGTEKKERKRRSVSRDEKSPVERPSRERKTVERLVQSSPRKISVSKVLAIDQGPGTKLKDIPNVFFKLSKRKTDENLQVLHTILFGRKSNAHYLKRNIAQFSGFVWAGNEEKQRARIKEKLDKCVKDKLLDFCVLLDIQTVRSTSKKEEITEKLLEYLESPHVTRDVVLAEKEKKGKRKRRSKGISQTATGGASPEREMKKQKSTLEIEVKKGRRRSSKSKKEDEDDSGLAEKENEDEHGSSDEDVDEAASTGEEDASNAEKENGDTEEESDHVKSEKEEEDEPVKPMASKKGSKEKQKKVAGPKMKEKALPVKKATPPSKGQTSKRSKADTKEKSSPVNKGSLKIPKGISKSSPRKSTVDDSDSGPPSSVKAKITNKKKDQSNDKDNKAGKKQAAKTKEQGKKGKGSGDANVGPSTEELHSVASTLLKEVDFYTATLADIIKQLGAHFKTDLTSRKAEVKQIVEDVINNMTDDEDGDEDEDNPEDAEGGEDAKEESDGVGGE